MLNLIKRIVKRSLQHIAANFGRHNGCKDKPQLAILMYHRILPKDDIRAQAEEAGMMVTPETFRLHMSIIKQSFEIIHLSQWLELKNNGKKLPLNACAVTFDDGWADNFEFAFPILQELNIPATIFLVSDMVGNNETFWPERMATLLITIANQHSEQWTQPYLRWIIKLSTSYDFTALAPTQDQIGEIIAATKIYGDIEIHQRLNDIEKNLNISSSDKQSHLLSWHQINTMCKDGLIEAGSHTCHHIRLTSDIEDKLLKQEITNSKNTIENQTGKTVKTFCYPNGDYCDAALSLVKQYYTGAVTTEHGWNMMDSNNHLLDRIGFHEDISYDKTSFLARLSGWL